MGIEMAMYAYNVYLNGKLIDTVYACYNDSEAMRKCLIDHDGYNPNILVKLKK